MVLQIFGKFSLSSRINCTKGIFCYSFLVRENFVNDNTSSKTCRLFCRCFSGRTLRVYSAWPDKNLGPFCLRGPDCRGNEFFEDIGGLM